MPRTSPHRPSIREINLEGIRWIDVQEPNAAAIRKVLSGISVHPLDIEDILSPAQRPKLARRGGYLFAVLRFARAGKRHVYSSELDAVISERTLLTFHGRELPRVREVMSDATLFAAKRRELLQHGPDYALFEVLRRCYQDLYNATDQLSRQLDQLEEDIFVTHSRQTTFNVAELRRLITDHRKLAKPQAIFLRELGLALVEYVGNGTQEYWRTLPQIAESQWELLGGFHDTIETLADTDTTLASHKLNQTFRVLTIISAIFLPATFLTQLFALSVPGIPFSDLEFGFALVVAVLVLVELGFVFMLRRLKVL